MHDNYLITQSVTFTIEYFWYSLYSWNKASRETDTLVQKQYKEVKAADMYR